MTDGESITQLMYLYAFAIDTKQYRLFNDVFTADVHADYPARRWVDLESWCRDFETGHRDYDVTEHLILNVMWKVSGESARAVSRCHFHLIRDGHSIREGVAGGAWYDDELKKTGDGWRISKRVCRVTWTNDEPGTITMPATSMSDGVTDGTLTFLDVVGDALPQ